MRNRFEHRIQITRYSSERDTFSDPTATRAVMHRHSRLRKTQGITEDRIKDVERNRKKLQRRAAAFVKGLDSTDPKVARIGELGREISGLRQQHNSGTISRQQFELTTSPLLQELGTLVKPREQLG